jgi:hypothetical protein
MRRAFVDLKIEKIEFEENLQVFYGLTRDDPGRPASTVFPRRRRPSLQAHARSPAVARSTKTGEIIEINK